MHPFASTSPILHKGCDVVFIVVWQPRSLLYSAVRLGFVTCIVVSCDTKIDQLCGTMLAQMR